MYKKINKKQSLKTQPTQIGGIPDNEPNCREFFKDGECPKLRWSNNSCPMNIIPNRDFMFCCMKKENIKGGVTYQGETDETM
jgi:hypothetical protein